MRATYITGYKPDGLLEVGDLPEPSPGAKDVVVRVFAAAINPVDGKIWAGAFRKAMKPPMPLVLGMDFSGEVVQAPAGSSFKAGDEVFGTLPRRMGTFAELVAADESALALKPRPLSHVEAAALPLVSLTAWQSIVEIARLRRGERVFIQAGGGGFGSVAVQIAKAQGAIVSTTASERHHAMLHALGADHIFDYHSGPYEAAIRGQDVAIETIDGMLARTVQTLKPGSRLVSLVGPPDRQMLKALGLPGPIAWLAGNKSSRPARRLARTGGASYRAIFVRADGARLEELADLVDQGALKPVVDRVFSLSQAGEALGYVGEGKASGKVVLKITE